MTSWTADRQAPLSIGFFRQEYWSGWPFPPPGDLPDPGTEPESSVSPTPAAGFFTTEPPEWSPTRGEYVLQGTLAKCVGPLLVVTVEERGSWSLEGRGLGCCSTTYLAQGTPHNKALPGQQVNRTETE